MQAIRCRPREPEFIQRLSSRLMLVFARLPLDMDVVACAMGALSIAKAVFQHLPSQVAPATLKLGRLQWLDPRPEWGCARLSLLHVSQ